MGNDQCSFRRFNLVLNTDHKRISEDRNLPKSFPPKYLKSLHLQEQAESPEQSASTRSPLTEYHQSVPVVLFYSSSWLVTQQLSPSNCEKYRDVQAGYRARRGQGWAGSSAPLPTQPCLLPPAGKGSSCLGGGPCPRKQQSLRVGDGIAAHVSHFAKITPRVLIDSAPLSVPLGLGKMVFLQPSDSKQALKTK